MEPSRIYAAGTTTSTSSERVGSRSSTGEGSSIDTIFNVTNIAAGAGMLGLPYAIQGAGFVSGIIGLGLVLLWNYVCCGLLVELRGELLAARARARKDGGALGKEYGTPVSFAAVGSFALGTIGTALVYVSVVVTLVGAGAAYFINANELLSKTHLYLDFGWSDTTAMYANTLIYMILMYPLTCINSLAPLSKVSLPAIIAIVAGFGVIIKLGLDMYGFPSLEEIISWDSLYVPQTFEGFSAFFGVASFSYGATIIILEIQESMADTSEFIDSLKTSLWVIWAGYSIFGGASLLVFQQHGPVGDNIMTQLPGHTAALEPLLILITIATLFTYPLAMQPVASVCEQALIKAGFGQPSSSIATKGPGYGAVPVSGSDTEASLPPADASPIQAQLGPWLKYGSRAALVFFTGFCATSVPNFGVVVSLLGSFSVTLGSFVLPPLFHYLVLRERLSTLEKLGDALLFLLGAFTCVFTTTVTALKVIRGDV